jgi:hypothetical protein
MVAREYSQEEKIAYVEEFKSSGMTSTAFAREKNIPDTTFRGWLRLERAMAFGEIDLKPSNVSETSKVSIKKTMVFAKDDIRIELKEGFDKQFLRNIIEVLLNAN